MINEILSMVEKFGFTTVFAIVILVNYIWLCKSLLNSQGKALEENKQAQIKINTRLDTIYDNVLLIKKEVEKCNKDCF